MSQMTVSDALMEMRMCAAIVETALVAGDITGTDATFYVAKRYHVLAYAILAKTGNDPRPTR